MGQLRMVNVSNVARKRPGQLRAGVDLISGRGFSYPGMGHQIVYLQHAFRPDCSPRLLQYSGRQYTGLVFRPSEGRVTLAQTGPFTVESYIEAASSGEGWDRLTEAGIGGLGRQEYFTEG